MHVSFFSNLFHLLTLIFITIFIYGRGHLNGLAEMRQIYQIYIHDGWSPGRPCQTCRLC